MPPSKVEATKHQLFISYASKNEREVHPIVPEPLVPAVHAVFVGDGLTTRHVLTGRAGMQPAPFTDEPALALESLDRLSSLDATWVLPGHGAPWCGRSADVAAAVRAAR